MGALGDSLLAAVTDIGVEEAAMEARVQAKIDANTAMIAALQANPTAAETQSAIAALQAENVKLKAFVADTPGSPPGTVPPGGQPPVTEVP